MAVSDNGESGPAEAEVHAYCREVEAYLCRRNQGHLIRVVGPAFDLVKHWAEIGVPLTVAKEGIDRTVERAERRPGRRRPVRIEFCEADVLDGYDRWRRAIGVVHAAAPAVAAQRRGTLTAHIERVTAELAVLQGSDRAPAGLREPIRAALGELDGLRAASGAARGVARDAILTALGAIDARLVEAAAAATPPDRRQSHGREAERDLQAYRGRLSPAQWESAVAGASARLLRAEVGLPVVSFD
jgi:hypothetical protein